MKSRLGKQTILFFAAQALNAVLGLVAAFILTSRLSATEWGRYTFLLSLITIGSVLMDFGLNSAAKRLVAVSSKDEERQVTAATLVYGLGLGFAFMIILAGISFILDDIFTNQTGSGAALLPLVPFVLLYPIVENVITIAQGANQITLLSVATVLPRVFYILVLVLLSGVVLLDASVALGLLLLSSAVAALTVALCLKPVFASIGDSIRKLYTEIREFGIHLYYGRAVDGVTSGFDRLIITQFHGLQPTGYYGLAMTFVSPVAMFSRAISASAYRDFTVQPVISRKTLLANTAGSIAAGAALTLGFMVIMPMFFHEKYSEALSVLPYLAVGAVLMALNAPYHSFLAAKRQGRALKIMSIVTSGLNIVLCAVLIPLLSMLGGAIAFIATYGVNLVMNLHYYSQAIGACGTTGNEGE